MAVSRPFLLVVLGAVLVVGTFASMRSAAERAQADDTAVAPTVVKTTPEPAAKQKTSPAPAAPKAKQSAAAKPEKKKPKTVAGLPPKVGKAFKARRTIVLFFRQPAADDDATAKAVGSVRGVKGVSVFSAPLSRLADYRRVVTGLGVTQAPAVVIVGKDRKARLVEGYVDPTTLRQQVRDAK